MKVLVLFDGISALGPTPDLLILETVEAVERALEEDGHTTQRIPVEPDSRWIERVRKAKPDLVFNLCEGIDGVAALEPAVIGTLELLGIPFTGSSSWTTSLCLRKHLVNALLDGANLPVPRFAVSRSGEHHPPVVGFPAICKPAAEDASLGVEQRSVVRNVEDLAHRLGDMHARWREILVQRYIEGREVNVGIVGDTVLPIAEIDFTGMPRGLWKIVSYRSKWETGCEEDLGAAPKCPANLTAELNAELARITRAAWKLVGGEGYGRCDFRIDRSGHPWLLEVNANPDFSPDAGLARMARVAGLDYAALVRLVVDHAIERAGRTRTWDETWRLTQLLSGVEASVAEANSVLPVTPDPELERLNGERPQLRISGRGRGGSSREKRAQ